jgi:predicted O-linked N-acetylglucosamine transferase (SPINDLY family)
MAELFEQHNKNEFEIIGFSFGPTSHDGVAKRISEAFSDFIDVRSHSDIAIARLSRQLDIDIAVDLKGFTQGQRVGIFSYRAAPIQVNYLGYPGTMGASYMDYIIADRSLIPESSQPHYSEKVVYLPDSYQANDRKRFISERQFTRDEVGLPPDGFVYCCFNNNYKITPSMLDSWSRILNAVDGSVLWLLQDNPEAEKNLRREATRRGLDPQRLIFGERLDLPDHLARHRLANLFLDTLPCNAHTTASDALWAGLPVITCPGESFASRVASSLLCAIGLPELIATSLQNYEDMAIRLARDPASLDALKMKLDANRLVAPLFDTKRYTAKLEDAYRVMIQRAISDRSPEHIDIH